MRATNRFTAPLRIIPRQSPRCLQLCAGLHLVSAAMVLASGAWGWQRIAIIVAIGISAHLSWRELRAAPLVFGAFLYDSQGVWWATTHTGERFAVHLTGTLLCLPFLVVLPAKIAARRYTIVLAADVIPKDLMRRLRIRLRFAPSTPTTISAAE